MSKRIGQALVSAAFLFSYAGPSRAQVTAAEQVSVSSASVVIVASRIPPIEPPNDDATGSITVQNNGNDAVMLQPSVGELKRGGDTVGGRVTIKFDASTVKPKSSITGTVVVNDLAVAGTATVPVFNNGSRIGEISIVKYPFAVSWDDPPAAVATIRGGGPVTVTLVNADPVRYTATAHFTIGGRRLCSGENEDNVVVRSCAWSRVKALFSDAPACMDPVVSLPANQKTTIDFFAPCDISSGVLSGLLKDEMQDGRMSLTLHPPADVVRETAAAVVTAVQRDPTSPARTTSPPPTANDDDHANSLVRLKPVNFVVGYAFTSIMWRQFWSTALLGLILTLGGICSLVSRYWVPNEMAKRDLVDKLHRFDVRASTLSGNVGSELRVAMRVETKRLTELARSISPLSGETSTQVAEYDKRYAALEARFEQLERLDTAWDRLRHDTGLAPAPSAVRIIEERLTRAAHLLTNVNLTPLDLEQVRTATTDAFTAIEGLSVLDDKFQEAAKQRLAELKTSFVQEPALREGSVIEGLKAVLPGPFLLLTTEPPIDAWFDAKVAVLALVREYIRLLTVSTDETVVGRLTSHRQDLIRLLSSPTGQNLRDAELLVAQMREGIFESDVRLAIQQRQFAIESDPREFSAYQTVHLHVRLHRPELNDSAARRRITCTWQFVNPATATPAAGSERGWEICHYFAQEKNEVGVTFFDGNGIPIGAPGTEKGAEGEPISMTAEMIAQQVGSTGPSARMRAELVGLGVVLFIALLGLLTGAQEQITKLDLIPGLIAVFLLGFGADSIKSLLTQRPA